MSLELGGGEEVGLFVQESLVVSVLCCRSYGSEDEVLDRSTCSCSGSVVTKDECPLDSTDFLSDSADSADFLPDSADSDDFLIWVTEGFLFSSLVTDPDLSCAATSATDPSEFPLLESEMDYT